MSRSFRLGVALGGELRLGVVTDDTYTDEDARYLRSAGVLEPERCARSRPGPARTPPSATPR